MLRCWAKVLPVAGMLLMLASCGAGGEKSGQATLPTASASSAAASGATSAPAATPDSIDGVEVKGTPCWQPAADASSQDVAVDGLKGTIAVRVSQAADTQCVRYYWGRFQPEAGSTKSFTVTFTKGDTEAPKQISEPKQPTWAAFTVGYHGKVGEKLIACVTPAGGSAICTDTTVA